jgi:hypothetical protein
MSAASRERRLKNNRRMDYAHWIEPKRRFYFCLFALMIFGVLQHWNWIFSFGAFGAIATHAAIALYTGDIYVRTLGLKSCAAVYHRQDSAYGVALFIHLAILLLFLLTLLLRICGL